MSTTRTVPHTPFPSVRAATTAVAGLAAAALALTGCTGGGHGSTPPSPPVHRSPSAAAAPAQESPASDRTRDLPGESVTEAPDLSGIKVVARAVNAHGSAEIDVPGRIGPGPLSIAVNCEGGGTLKVSVDATALSFPVHCTAGKVAGVLNRMDRPHGTRHAHATVTVTAPTGVRWSLAVGR